MKTRIPSRQLWLTYEPPHQRDIRLIKSNFKTLGACERERDVSAHILSNGSRRDRALGDDLRDAQRGKLARTFCCPLLARQFQIFFVSRSLKVIQRCEQRALLTLFDPDDAVEDLEGVDWPKMHARLRRRLGRCIGADTVALGVGEVEFDETRALWQPHYHLVLVDATEEGLSRLRKHHYASKKGEARSMVRSAETDLVGWLAYMSKLMAFRKIPAAGGGTHRVRLKPRHFRKFLRYAAEHNPSTFVFTLNCSVIKSNKTQLVVVDKNVGRRRRILRKRC